MKKILRALGLVVFFNVLYGLFYLLLELASPYFPGIQRRDVGQVLAPWFSLFAVLAATYLMLRVVEKRPWSDVGLDGEAARPRLVAGGAVLGGLTIGLASLFLLAIHQLRISRSVPGSWLASAGYSLAVLLPAGFFEELFIRGYVFAVLRRAAGWRIALIVTSAVFGVLHAWNPGADAESILAVTVAGFFLGAFFLATGSLYATGAAHVAWNWVMAAALHTPVSGIPVNQPDYTMIDSGPDWLTGGRWGPEGGIAAVAAMFVVIFYLYGRYLRSAKLELPA
jgi:membrane protease YdiL (CAAX protease family)